MKKILSFTSIYLSVCVLVSACGFEPIYGVQNSNPNQASVNHVLSHVEIANIPDREGQYIRNALIDRFYSNGRPVEVSYLLNVSPIKESIVDLDLTKSSDATRAQLHLTTQISLIDQDSGKAVLTRNLSAVSSYNVLTSEFANRVSEQNTRENTLNDLARQIELQIGLYLRRK